MILERPVGRVLSLVLTGALAAVVYFAFIKDKVDSSSDPMNARDKSLFKATNFTMALGAVRAREGGGAPLLKVEVVPRRAEFQVAAGERARGYRYDADSGDVEEIEGTGGGSQFSLRRVPPDVTERLARAVRRHRGLHATTMTLERGPGGLRWRIEARGRVFAANGDGSGLR